MKKWKGFVGAVVLATVFTSGVAAGGTGLARAAVRVGGSTLRRTAATAKLSQTIEGPSVYNLVWEHSAGTGYLRCYAKSKVRYEVLYGGECLELDGAKIIMKKRGVAYVRATAEETSIYQKASKVLAISCEKEPFVDGVGEVTKQWSGSAQEYKYKSSVGISSCQCEYALHDDKVPIWSTKKPKERNKYLVKLNLVTTAGNKITRFSTMIITKKILTIKALKVKTKVYDGTTNAELTGELSGVINGDDVALTLPRVKFASADVGNLVAVKKVSGNFGIVGTGTGNYTLKTYRVKDIHGKILPLDGVITVQDKSSVQGEKPSTLTFSCYPKDVDVKGVKLKCKVKKNTPPGSYEITASGAKAKNYKFSYVAGTYVVQPKSVEPKPDTGTMDDWDPVATAEPEPDYTEEDTSPVDNMQPADEGTQNSNLEPTATPVEEKKLPVCAASNSVRFDGVADSPQIEGDTIEIKQVYTSTGRVSSTDTGFEVRCKKSGWVTELNVPSLFKDDLQKVQLMEGQAGECGVINGLEIEVRDKLNPKQIAKIRVGKYVVDREVPAISLEGSEELPSRTEETSIVSANAVQIGVSVLFGLTGEKSISYRLVSDEDIVTAESAGWKKVVNGSVTIAQDFEGQMAVRAVDALGNYSIVYSERMKVDAAPPKIDGVKSGEKYPGAVKYTVEDLSGIKSVTVDGEKSEEKGSVTGKGTHVITAEDNNGNSTSVTFTIESQGFIKDFVAWIKSIVG